MTVAVPSEKSKRNTLLLLAGVFFLPFVIGTGLFWVDWRPEKYSNHGELLQPARPLPDTGLSRADGQPLPTSAIRGKWLLVLPATGMCDHSCESSLQMMGQVYIALNKEQNRLQRVFITYEGITTDNKAALTALQLKFPDIVVASVSANEKGKVWHDALGGGGQDMFIVDSLGNVMMRYADPVDMRGVLKDLERLLKYSWIR